MGYKTIAETCYFKTGREGIVFEALDLLQPNLFDDNRNIGNSIFHKGSKFKFTLVDARKTSGKGSAVYYNLDPNEVLLLNYLLSDGNPEHFKKRVGAYSSMDSNGQLYVKNIIETFDSIDFARFDRVMDYSKGKEGTSIMFQKNILNYNSTVKNELLVRRISISYEENMRSASKWKLTIEQGRAMKDVSRGNGLNIVKYGTYESVISTPFNMQVDEIMAPISEAAKRVILSQPTFYSLMKRAEVDFTRRKFKNKDWEGDRIDIWNPQGKSFYKPVNKQRQVKETKLKKPNSKEAQLNDNTANVDNAKDKISSNGSNKKSNQKVCSDCNINIPDNVYNYSLKVHKKPLCFNCQKKQ